MGLSLGKFLTSLFWSSREFRVVMLGLDAAGKTTILYKLHLGEVVSTIPTIGFNVETIQRKNFSLTVWDVGGQARIRPLWRHYFHGAQAVIFVVDSTDKERFDEAADELHAILANEDLRKSSVLVLANKQDLPQAAGVAEIAKSLRLADVAAGRPWYVQPTCATSGDGIEEGLGWLSSQLLA